MTEVNKTYDLLPSVDHQAYFEYCKMAIRIMAQAPGVVEIRVYRNLLNSTRVRLTLVWQTLADWAKFAESPEQQKLAVCRRSLSPT
jgi:heme-degrading monooxygenase HmoA